MQGTQVVRLCNAASRCRTDEIFKSEPFIVELLLFVCDILSGSGLHMALQKFLFNIGGLDSSITCIGKD